jgi:4-alpha-glucanotransferase
MTDPLVALKQLAQFMGVATRYQSGLGHDVVVSPDTLVRICASLGAPIDRIDDAASALRSQQADRADELLAPTVVAWDGRLDAVPVNTSSGDGMPRADLTLEDGTALSAESTTSTIGFADALPMGYHRLRIETGRRTATCTVIAAPERSWHRPGAGRSWGVSAHLAALRSSRSRSVGDLTDLVMVAEWVGAHGGDLVSLLPLLPTFNDPPTEPSPYSPVSRLFWSELILDLGAANQPLPAEDLLQVERADAEVRRALVEATGPDPASVDMELARYAMFRAAQKKLGRDWRAWPERQRNGQLGPGDIDPDEERFHLVAQTEVGRQLIDLRRDLDRARVRLGLDLAVGVHPDGYDAWARRGLFADGISVGAPPDPGFPSGQSWGFPPVLPRSSRREGHAYIAASIAHQAALAGVLRIDHIMAMNRLYWIPDGLGLAEGTYVDYPTEELFAVLCLESHRNDCELVGENLGTVPPEIDDALPRHRIWGMYLAEFEAGPGEPVTAPSADQAAMIDTHDTPTFSGWLDAVDVDERVRLGLLDDADAPQERAGRLKAARRLARDLRGHVDDPDDLLARVIKFLGGSASPLVVLWLEDLWLETQPVNVPGSSSAERPNWRRPMSRLLEQPLQDPDVNRRLEAIEAARRQL